MKVKKPQSFKMQLLLFTLLICSTAQAQLWRLGGNSNLPAADDITAPGANQLGSQAGFNVPINFITNGTQRMIIDNGGTGTAAGRIAIGNNLPSGFLPTARFHIHQDGRPEFIRFTNTTTGTGINSGFAMGLQTNPGQVGFIQNSNQPITWSIPIAATLTEFMRMNDGTGFIGMGPNSLNAAFQLAVDNDININTTYAANTNNQLGFRINSEKILNNFGVNNIFVGVNAGLNNTFAGNQNTFVGFNAGSANIDGNRNTFLGSNAGQSVVSSDFNTFIGTDAGRILISGNHNTFVGEQAGDKQISGKDNSYFGTHAGGE